MSKNEWKKLVGVAGRLLLAFVFVFSQTAWAGQNQQTKDKAASPQKVTAQQAAEKQSASATAKAQSSQAQGEESESSVAVEKPGDASHQGIKVHGHWTIEVKNPDGTLVTHREFENSIQASGTVSLTSLLAGSQLLGPWQVDLIGSPQPCVENEAREPSGFTAGPQPCIVVPSNTLLDNGAAKPGFQVGAISFNLTVTASSGQLVLNGTVIAATSTSVSSVATVMSPCIGSPTVTSNLPNPSTLTCPALVFPIPAPFTSATLTQGVPVSAGQTIAVTVTISFS